MTSYPELRSLLLTTLLGAAFLASVVPGQSAEWTIYYDSYSTPHCFGEAASPADQDRAAMFAFGYHQARDFPIATLNLLWLTSGQMASIAGESYVDEDIAIRLWRLEDIATVHRGRLGAVGLLPLVEAYVDGVNAGREWWLESERYKRILYGPAYVPGSPPIAPGVYIETPPDYLNYLKGPYEMNAVAMERVLAKLFSSEVTDTHVLCAALATNSDFLYFSNQNEKTVSSVPKTPPTGSASNQWILNPGEAGLEGLPSPVLHGSPHVRHEQLNLHFYFAQVQGSEYQASGIAIPGLPIFFHGFNDWVSWSLTAPARASIVTNRWEIKLLAGTPLHFNFIDGTPGGVDSSLLGLTENDLRVYDPLSDSTSTRPPFKLYYVVDPSPGPGLPLLYPVVSPDPAANASIDDPVYWVKPGPGDTIEFAQHSFTGAGSLLEFFLLLGKARKVPADASVPDVQDAFQAGPPMIGFAKNLLFLDRDGQEQYLFSSRVPIQGPGVLPSEYGEVLNGRFASERWQGIYATSELPQVSPSRPGLPRALICNNAAPEVVDPSIDPAAYPPEMLGDDGPSTTWRQMRAQVLFDDPAQWSLEKTEDVAVDQQDVWMHMMWPFFIKANDSSTSMSEYVCLFMKWVEDHRQMDLCDTVSLGADDFIAHKFSQVTVWTTLLRAYYEVFLADQSPTGLAADFGLDPGHPLFGDPSSFTDTGPYHVNLEAMRCALERIANPDPSASACHSCPGEELDTGLWWLGDSILDNQRVLKEWSPCIDPMGRVRFDPWNLDYLDSPCLGVDRPGCPFSMNLFDSKVCQASRGGAQCFGVPNLLKWKIWLDMDYPLNQPIGNWDKVIRWGHVNVMSLTPHRLSVRSSTLPDSNGCPRPADCFDEWAIATRIQPRSGACPPGFSCSGSLGAVPYFEHEVIAAPMGGVQDSLFTTYSKAIGVSGVGGGFLSRLHQWNQGSGSSKLMYHVPIDAGTSVQFLAEMTPAGVNARYMALRGGTELTEDLDPELGYQDQYGPTREFIDLQWCDFPTVISALSGPGVTPVSGTFP